MNMILVAVVATFLLFLGLFIFLNRVKVKKWIINNKKKALAILTVGSMTVAGIYLFPTEKINEKTGSEQFSNFFITTHTDGGFTHVTIDYDKAWNYIKSHIFWRLDAYYSGSWHNDISGLSVSAKDSYVNSSEDGNVTSKRVSLIFNATINPSARYRIYLASDLPEKWFKLDTINTTIKLQHTAFGQDFYLLLTTVI